MLNKGRTSLRWFRRRRYISALQLFLMFLRSQGDELCAEYYGNTSVTVGFCLDPKCCDQSLEIWIKVFILKQHEGVADDGGRQAG